MRVPRAALEVSDYNPACEIDARRLRACIARKVQLARLRRNACLFADVAGWCYADD